MSYEYFGGFELADDEVYRLVDACARAAGMLVLGMKGNRCDLRWIEGSSSEGDDYDVCVYPTPGGALASFHSFRPGQRERLLVELERAFTEATSRPVVFEET